MRMRCCRGERSRFAEKACDLRYEEPARHWRRGADGRDGCGRSGEQSARIDGARATFQVLNINSTRTPPSERLWISMWPPWRSIIVFVTARPSPVPFPVGFVV